MDALARLKELKLPFAELMGIEFVEASLERVVARMTARAELCTRPAVLHGGAIMAFADTLGAAGTILNLPPNGPNGGAGTTTPGTTTPGTTTPGTTTPGTTTPGTTTIESKTNFIAAAPLGSRIIGEATPLHRGRRTQVWQTRVTTDEGKLVAVVTQTQLVL